MTVRPLDAQIEDVFCKLYQCKCISEAEVKSLCNRAKELLINENNVKRIHSPVTVCGDIHGQFHDLLKLFEEGGKCPETNYLFLGDYVDRGYRCCETFLLLLALKVRYPNRITLLRGNHETRQITQVYGFYDECFKKFGSINVWRYCTDIFDYLTISAIIDGSIFCVHGGLSPNIISLDQIRLINRRCEVPHEGAMCDLLWSDPEIVESWDISARGAGFVFGHNQVSEFNRFNCLTKICRAHQLVMEGYKEMFDKQLVTVWSAPNYCYRCGNLASIMKITNITYNYTVFEASDRQDSDPPVPTVSEYFL